MKKEFNVECNVGAPMVSYRETFKSSAQVQGKSAQSGGRGQYGDVHIEFTPKRNRRRFRIRKRYRWWCSSSLIHSISTSWS